MIRIWAPLVAWWARSRLRREAPQHAKQVEHVPQEHRQELHLCLWRQPGRS